MTTSEMELELDDKTLQENARKKRLELIALYEDGRKACKEVYGDRICKVELLASEDPLPSNWTIKVSCRPQDIYELRYPPSWIVLSDNWRVKLRINTIELQGLLVAFTGAKGAGKSTAAEMLKDYFSFKELAFAGPLKGGCGEMFGFDYGQMYDPERKETVDPFWGVTPREVLQFVGTELMRDQLAKRFPSMANVWIKRWTRTYTEMSSDARIVVSDWRFPDEGDALKAQGAILIRIVRPNQVHSNVGQEHSSEHALDAYPVNYTLYNDGSLDDLYVQIHKLFTMLLGKQQV